MNVRRRNQRMTYEHGGRRFVPIGFDPKDMSRDPVFISDDDIDILTYDQRRALHLSTRIMAMSEARRASGLHPRYMWGVQEGETVEFI